LFDSSQAAELMEGTVATLSRYLDRKDVAIFSREIEGLVARSFQRAVRREVTKQNRLVPLEEGSCAPPKCAVDESWPRQLQAHLELQEFVRLLADKSRSVLALRYAGYTWKETALVMGESVTVLRSAFWRDVSRVKRRLGSQGSSDCGKQN
jgi:DNA-directed RNA polymerase specialized sigma24 family protein